MAECFCRLSSEAMNGNSRLRTCNSQPVESPTPVSVGRRILSSLRLAAAGRRRKSGVEILALGVIARYKRTHEGRQGVMTSPRPLFLDEEQVRQHLRMADLIPAMEKALIDFSTGKVTQPVRSIIKVDPPGGFFGMMPALAEGLGIKIVTFYPPNAERGLPTHMATIFLVDPPTGAPLAIMDGRLITEMRTAAVSAAATKHLASPEAHVLAILGSGVQARSHFEALSLVRQFDEIRIWSRTTSSAEQLAKEIGGKAMSAEQG